MMRPEKRIMCKNCRKGLDSLDFVQDAPGNNAQELEKSWGSLPFAHDMAHGAQSTTYQPILSCQLE
jgi:hypothetical protein